MLVIVRGTLVSTTTFLLEFFLLCASATKQKNYCRNMHEKIQKHNERKCCVEKKSYWSTKKPS